MKALLREVPRRGDAKPERSWLWSSALIVIGIGVIAGLVVGAPPKPGCFGDSKVDLAMTVVKKYAFEAYPSWRELHGQVCPVELVELNELMDDKYLSRDPWGGYYQMRCDESGIVVRSPGEDGKYNTEDDVRSD